MSDRIQDRQRGASYDGPTIASITEAYEALDSFDPAATKRALRVLVDAGDPGALARVLPLTQNPDPAIRFVAKRAVTELRSLVPLAGRSASRLAPLTPEPAITALPSAVGESRVPDPWDLDPRVQRLLDAPARRREPRPRAGGVPMRWFDMEL